MTPVAAQADQFQCTWNVPRRIRNSPTKPLSMGKPSEESATKRKKAASLGIGVARPPYSEISKGWRRAESMATGKKRAAGGKAGGGNLENGPLMGKLFKGEKRKKAEAQRGA